MDTYDIAIIGAGPCGIACALNVADKFEHVAIIEGGNYFKDRYCAVDARQECRSCKTCNVISGFGGCVHYGDSAKLTYYPSGKALKTKLGEDYNRIRDKACALWDINSEKDFVYNATVTGHGDFNYKGYPVCVLGSEAIKDRVNTWWLELQEKKVKYINKEMINFEKNADSFIVSLNNQEELQCKKLVLAMGRQGLIWLKENISSKGIKYNIPISSMGVRFEMPKCYLSALGNEHPDFKARVEFQGTKYKTFCFCAGIHGGRLKFTNYGEYTLLDGHILEECDEESEYANFALLRQIVPLEKEADNNCLVAEILQSYHTICKGRPIYQSYLNFSKMISDEFRLPISTPCVKEGPVYQLLGKNLNDFCCVAQKIFNYIADQNHITVDKLLPKVNVVGLELEGLWNKIITDGDFMASIDGLYAGGDCSGEAQGILQATMMGIKIAEALCKKDIICKEAGGNA